MVDNRPALKKLSRVLNVIKEYDAKLLIGHVHLLILVSLNEGKSVSELAELSKGKLSSVSRYLLDMSHKVRSGGPGYNLITREPDAHDLRKYVFRLTPAGRALVGQVEALLEQ